LDGTRDESVGLLECLPSQRAAGRRVRSDPREERLMQVHRALGEPIAPLLELCAEVGFCGIEPEAQLDERPIQVAQRLTQAPDAFLHIHKRSSQGIFAQREFVRDSPRESCDRALSRAPHESLPAGG
jgi:hypothetical protein